MQVHDIKRSEIALRVTCLFSEMIR